MSGCGWMIRMGDRRAETMRNYYVRRCLCSKSPDRCTKKILSEVLGSKTLTLKPGGHAVAGNVKTRESWRMS